MEINSSGSFPRDTFDLLKDILSMYKMGIWLYHDSSNCEDNFQIPLGMSASAKTHVRSGCDMIFVACNFDRF